jgi:SnoaL-like domain
MNKISKSRRAFFLQGGAMFGAGVATAATATSGNTRSQPDDLEAIRQLHMALARLVENQGIGAAGDLFEEQPRLLINGVGADDQPELLRIRSNHLQHRDSLVISADGLQATATWHADVSLATPIRGDSTVAQMARLQGQMASHSWVAGNFKAQYVKARGQWKIASLDYSTV